MSEMDNLGGSRPMSLALPQGHHREAMKPGFNLHNTSDMIPDRLMQRALPGIPHSASAQNLQTSFVDDSPMADFGQRFPSNIQDGGMLSSSTGHIPGASGPAYNRAFPLADNVRYPVCGSNVGVANGTTGGAANGVGGVNSTTGGGATGGIPTRGYDCFDSRYRGLSEQINSHRDSFSQNILTPESFNMAPITMKQWTITHATNEQSRNTKKCKLARWSSFQWMGICLFILVVSVCGYAVYNGVVAAIKSSPSFKEHQKGENFTTTRRRFTFNFQLTTLERTPIKTPATTVSVDIHTIIPSPAPTTTPDQGPKTTLPHSGTTLPSYTAVPPSLTTHVSSVAITTPSTLTTTEKKKKKKEPAYCSLSIGRLMKVVTKDDGRCRGYSAGIHLDQKACNRFHVCFAKGRLLRTGRCPCGRHYDDINQSCVKHKMGYIPYPNDCGRFRRCWYNRIKDIYVRKSYTCHRGFAFNFKLKRPTCVNATFVENCMRFDTGSEHD